MWKSGAQISECERYRYALWRIWRDDLPILVFVMLNPSTADGQLDDPTITRCIRRAERMCYGGIIVVNLFAYRATDPTELTKVEDPIGPLNDQIILQYANKAKTIICAWGIHGQLYDRDAAVIEMLRNIAPNKLYYLALTKEGYPRHPLYVGYATQLSMWSWHDALKVCQSRRVKPEG